MTHFINQAARVERSSCLFFGDQTRAPIRPPFQQNFEPRNIILWLNEIWQKESTRTCFFWFHKQLQLLCRRY